MTNERVAQKVRPDAPELAEAGRKIDELEERLGEEVEAIIQRELEKAEDPVHVLIALAQTLSAAYGRVSVSFGKTTDMPDEEIVQTALLSLSANIKAGLNAVRRGSFVSRTFDRTAGGYIEDRWQQPSEEVKQ